MRRNIFISGGTGYIGVPLVCALAARGHVVRSIVRNGSAARLPAEAGAVRADALDASTFAGRVRPADTYIHLTGTPHPAPWKGAQFRAVDLESLRASALAARQADVDHFIYVSVARPAPVMKAYIQVRCECEEILRGSGMHATILRPWYVVGPGHWWPVVLKPFYAAAEWIPPLREGSRRLGLVTRRQMVAALVSAVENPASGVRVVGVPEIRA